MNQFNNDNFMKWHDAIIKESIVDYAKNIGLEIVKNEQDLNKQWDFCLKDNPKVKIDSKSNTFMNFGMSPNSKNSRGNIINFDLNQNKLSQDKNYREAANGLLYNYVIPSISVFDYASENEELVKQSPNQFSLKNNNSLRISLQPNIFKDFGDVDQGKQDFSQGNVINFIRYTENADFSQALEQALKFKNSENYTPSLRNYSQNRDFKYPRNIINTNRNKARDYLRNKRSLSKLTTDVVMNLKNSEGIHLVEQTKYGEAVFNWAKPFWFSKGINDSKYNYLGATVNATEKTLDSDTNEMKYQKRILKNSRTGYGFNFCLSFFEKPDSIAFAESSVDLLSMFDHIYHKGNTPNEKASYQEVAKKIHFQSTEGLKENIVENTINNYIKNYGEPPKRVMFGYDNDRAGITHYLKSKNLDVIKNNKIDVICAIPKKINENDKKADWNQVLSHNKSIRKSNNKQLKISNKMNQNRQQNLGRNP